MTAFRSAKVHLFRSCGSVATHNSILMIDFTLGMIFSADRCMYEVNRLCWQSGSVHVVVRPSLMQFREGDNRASEA
jgi:hypothetical protein